MIYLNEWLPNPVGPDATGEFVELYNSANGPVSLSGWKMGGGTATTTGILPNKTKPISLDGYSIKGSGYLVLKKPGFKLSLKNTDGGLLLYGPDGTVAEAAGFKGSAPVGESFSRIGYRRTPAQQFAFNTATPGAQNADYDNLIRTDHYAAGKTLSPGPSAIASSASAILIGAALAALFFHAFKTNEKLSHFLFGGN